MTDLEKAEEYFCKYCENSFEHDNGHCSNCSKWDYFIAGLTEGRKEKWHDLRKNPKDFPKEDGEYLVAYRDCQNENEIVTKVFNWEIYSFVDEHYKDIPYFDDKSVLIAWCELQKFEENNND